MDVIHLGRRFSSLLFTDRRAVVWFGRQPVCAVCLLFKYLASVSQWEMLKTNYYHVRTACRNAPMSSQFEACSQWGGGTERLKINLRQGRAVEKKGRRGKDIQRERKRERGRERVQRSKRSGPGGVPGFPLPRSSVYTQRNFGQFHSSPFSGHWKGTDSFLVTHPLSSESGCYHGKIQTFGILSGLPLCVAL